MMGSGKATATIREVTVVNMICPSSNLSLLYKLRGTFMRGTFIKIGYFYKEGYIYKCGGTGLLL